MQYSFEEFRIKVHTPALKNLFFELSFAADANALPAMASAQAEHVYTCSFAARAQNEECQPPLRGGRAANARRLAEGY